MLIEVIRLDERFLTIKLGNTEQECLECKAIDLPVHGKVDLYTTLMLNRKTVEEYLKNTQKTKLIHHKFPDGNIPITEL